MTISYLEPTAERAAPPEPYERRVDCSKRPFTLGLVANSFPDSAHFMNHVERALAELLPGATLKRYQKPTVDPISEATLEEVARDCDAVVASWGH